MTPPNILSLTLDAGGHTTPLRFPVRRLVNAGYVGRNQAAVRAHIDELRHEGIPPPAHIPALFPLPVDNVTTANQIEVVGGGTSGEVEYVLFLVEDEIFVGVGSDHTDRILERTSLGKSKQICKNVVSQQVWRLSDLKERWDDLLLQSWVRARGTREEILYQRGLLRMILAPDELIELVRSRIKDRQSDGLVIFSGTVPLQVDRIISGAEFRGELLDPSTGRTLTCAYRTILLEYLEEPE